MGDQKSTARLTVQEPAFDFITRLPDVTTVPLGKDAEFMVEISRPDVHVKWFRKDTEITESLRYMILSDKCVRKLIIKQVTLEDQTEYSCTAFSITTSSTLKVKVEKRVTAGKYWFYLTIMFDITTIITTLCNKVHQRRHAVHWTCRA